MSGRTVKRSISVAAIAALAIGMLVPSATVQARGDDTDPGLRVGQKAPNAVVKTIDGEKVKLKDLYGDGPVVITFYRGGWCPFCNRALTTWRDALPEIESAGARWVAITPQKPEGIEATKEKLSGNLEVLSDSQFSAAKAFKIFYEIPEQTQEKLKSYNIFIDKENANGQWQLPHPSTFIIDSKGVIRFAEVHVDYRQRTDPNDVLAALADID